MIAQINPTSSNGDRRNERRDRDDQARDKRPNTPAMGSARGTSHGPVSHEEEKRDGDGPKGDELRVGGGHAVTFSRDAGGAGFFDEALEEKVGGFAGELAGEGEEDFGFAGGEGEGDVDYAEGLGEEGEPGAEVGEGVCWVL